MSEVPERSDRILKLAALRSRGIDPYPPSVHRTHILAECIAGFDALAAEKQLVSIAGRIRSIRRHGGSTFAVLEDQSGRLQIFFKKDVIGEQAYECVKDLFDMGDFLSVTGTLFVTKTGEKTLETTTVALIAKALLPLPEQWHGLADIEMRYRKRELDLLSNPEVRARFETRSRFISSIRRFLDERGFLEVETPILQAIPGGANARAFTTHHNALDADLYLRIAPELYLKRLIVGGYEKVYEIGRLFRNEGIDHSHSPEFTELELYWAYVPDRAAFRSFLTALLKEAISASVGRLIIGEGKSALDFATDWPEKTFRQAIIDETGLDIDLFRTEKEVIAAVEKKKISIDFSKCVGLGEHVDELFKKVARPTIVQPTWISDYPLELKPLAKRSPSDPTKSASLQLLVAGEEIMNAYYHEQNDPIEQEKRFHEQEELRAHGSSESQYLDQDFLDALECGMPPTSGMGMGIDRIIRLLTGCASLKEIILFPTLRRKE